MTPTDDRLQLATDWLRQVLPERNLTMKLLAGDASFRRYFRATDSEGSLVLMDAPPSHEDIAPFQRIAESWYSAGVRVPKVIASSKNDGFLLLEDFGDETLFLALRGRPAEKLYPACLEALHRIQELPLSDDLPPYDEALLLREMQLFPDWLMRDFLSLECSPAVQQELSSLFELLTESALGQPKVVVHRDYHSRNLMVTPDQATPGIIDFQDAVNGPVTYDLVSLLKDCYVTLPASQRDAWVRAYYEQLPASLRPSGDYGAFVTLFRRMGMQRHLKAAGIFARLYLRDGKTGYLPDIPNTVRYLIEALVEEGQYPVLQEFLIKVLMPALEAKLATEGSIR